ncbi:GID complex subunit 4, VID24 [Dispira parvispora]|uniref:GID complex subunit 4, VID24 n=1 Tax=Dispira parvispora TaxID=1520584 RepID=A0A9W8APZ6_9FUNG|nr:GID complex subunit 4, VID24 [Dispira parvispora]
MPISPLPVVPDRTATTPHGATPLYGDRVSKTGRYLPSPRPVTPTQDVVLGATLSPTDSRAPTQSPAEVHCPVPTRPHKHKGRHRDTVRKARELRGAVDLINSQLLTPPTMKPLTTSHLYPGSRFVGRQRSGHNHMPMSHSVEVTIQDVDLNKSYLSGYLLVHNLTEDMPTLTTFFEAEIIGEKYGFLTNKWDATYIIDRDHWSHFAAFNTDKCKFNEEYRLGNVMDQEVIFMRWKELFLVPNHRIHNLSGASFDGFYYISYNQITGAIEGYYYHDRSDKYQHLTLTHIHDNAVPGYEFC